MEADEQDDAKFTARIDAAIKKRSGTSVAGAEVKAAEVTEKDSTEQDAKDSQKAAKLSSIMKRISSNKNTKKVTVED